jgi:hypothetical protein
VAALLAPFRLYGDLQIFSRYIQVYDFRYLGAYEVCTIVKKYLHPVLMFLGFVMFVSPLFKATFGNFLDFDAYKVRTVPGIENKREISCCAENPPFNLSGSCQVAGLAIFATG